MTPTTMPLWYLPAGDSTAINNRVQIVVFVLHESRETVLETCLDASVLDVLRNAIGTPFLRSQYPTKYARFGFGVAGPPPLEAVRPLPPSPTAPSMRIRAWLAQLRRRG